MCNLQWRSPVQSDSEEAAIHLSGWSPVTRDGYAGSMFPDLSLVPPEYEAVAAETWDLLQTGPRYLSDIAAHCRERGLMDDLVPSVFQSDIEAIDDATVLTPGIWTTRSGTAVRLDMLLSGRVFTHRPTDDERSRNAATLDPDLTILGADVSEFNMPLQLVDGRDLRVTYPFREEGEKSSVDGPVGWLDAGETLAFVKTDDGRVDVVPLNSLSNGEEEAAAIGGEFDATNVDSDTGYDLWPLLIEALASGEDLFATPVPPIGELLSSVGLEYRDGCVGPTDTEWLPPGVVLAQTRRAEISAMYGFDACCHVAFDTVVDAWDWSLGVVSREPDAVEAAKALGHGAVSSAFISWIDMRRGDLVDVGSFLEDLGERAGRDGALPLERAAWIWFTEGDVEAAIDNAEAAIALDPTSQEATVLLGHVAAIKGNYQESLRLLRRSFPEDGWVEILEEICEPFPNAKRNDPCPCGSGKKFKVCCAKDPQVSAIKRMHVLTHKIIAFLHTVAADRLHYLSSIAASADDRGDPNDTDRYVNHPFIIEIAAIEGSLDFFAAVWGPLLPQDEVDAVDLWRASTRALWEVTATPEGSHVTLRDTRTGDTVTVYDETATPNLQTGDLLMGIVAPAFGEDRFLGNPLVVDIRHRNMTLALFDEDPTDEELAHWFGLVTAPPRLQTTEGQDMVACRAVCEPSSTWEALTTELDANFERADDSDNEWETTFLNDADERVLRGTLRREDSQLIIETMSEERIDDILDTLTSVTVLEETREPVVIPSPLGPRPSSGSVSPAPLDPEARAMLAEIMQQKEEAWLDEEIPLLDGLTPRQAAADPTRRDDLSALLDSFTPARDDNLMGFDGERLRRLLKLN